jgi:predicted DNA-binding protein (MmcQ/YjbR family)
MDIQQYFDFCLSKKGVTEHFPFDEDTLVFKVGGKMFALASLKEWEAGNPAVNLKGEPGRNQELCAEYDGINPGYHMNKVHWVTVSVNEDVPDKLVLEMIAASYVLVFNTLTRKLQTEINEL